MRKTHARSESVCPPCHSEPVTDVTGVGIRSFCGGFLDKVKTGMHASCIPVPSLFRHKHFRILPEANRISPQNPQHFRKKQVNITAVEKRVENVQNPVETGLTAVAAILLFCPPFKLLPQNRRCGAVFRRQAPCAAPKNAVQYMGYFMR